MTTSPPCEHENFRADVAVGRIEGDRGEGVHAFVAEVTVVCVDCREPFGFKGPPAGLSWSEPRCSVDALTLHAPLMSPSELALEGPLPALARGPMVFEAKP